MADRIYTTDSAIIEAQLFDEETDLVTPVTAVKWYVQRPDGSQLLVDGALPLTGYTVGQRAASRTDNLINEWDGNAWVSVADNLVVVELHADNTSVLVVPSAGTDLEGLYTTRAQFTLADDTLSSTIATFEAEDPLAQPTLTGIDVAVEHAMMKLEDLFDSDLGGPWLQDKTFKAFDKRKMRKLLPDALYLINNYYQPITSFDDTNFPVHHYPLVSQALLVETMLHLIRSYTEQPLPSGANISYFDRRDYQARWQSVMTKEEERLNQYIDMFKMEYTGFGSTAVLVGGYATPLTRMSRYWRIRHPKYIGPWAG